MFSSINTHLFHVCHCRFSSCCDIVYCVLVLENFPKSHPSYIPIYNIDTQYDHDDDDDDGMMPFNVLCGVYLFIFCDISIGYIHVQCFSSSIVFVFFFFEKTQSKLNIMQSKL